MKILRGGDGDEDAEEEDIEHAVDVYGWTVGEFVTVHELVKKLDLEWSEDTLIFETPVRFKTIVKLLDTKHYGLPQTRSRGYMCVWQPDRIFDGSHLPGAPAPKESEIDIGELWLEMMEHVQEDPEYALTAFLPPDTAPHSVRFREVLRGDVAKKTARDQAAKNGYFEGASKVRLLAWFRAMATWRHAARTLSLSHTHTLSLSPPSPSRCLSLSLVYESLAIYLSSLIFSNLSFVFLNTTHAQHTRIISHRIAAEQIPSAGVVRTSKEKRRCLRS